MYQQQSYFQPNQYQTSMVRQAQPQGTPYLKGRLVSSIDEARAAPIDFDGSVFYFPDLANQRIYTKQINYDGTATLNMYELKEIPISAPVNTDTSMFITREEFEAVLLQLKQDLQKPQENKNAISPKLQF